MKACTLMVPCAGVLIAACTTVDIKQSNLPDDTSSILSPESNELPFTLRSTTLLLMPASASSTAAKSDPYSITVNDLCVQKKNAPSSTPTKAAQATATTKSTTSTKRSLRSHGHPVTHTDPKGTNLAQAPATTPASGSDKAWSTCLNNMRVLATPAQGGVYVATFHGDNTITSSSVAGQPLMLKSVSIGAGNATSNTITEVGGNVVAGAALGSGWGWAAVALISLWEITQAADNSSSVSATQSMLADYVGGKTTPQPTDVTARIEANLCPAGLKEQTDGIVTYSGYDTKTKPSLSLPIAVPVTIDSADFQCWMPVPAFLGSQDKPLRPLWFYRIVPTDVDPSQLGQTDSTNSSASFPPALGTTYVGPKNVFKDTKVFVGMSDSDRPNAFPTSACRKVEVQITWWLDLATANPKDNTLAKINPQIVKALVSPATSASSATPSSTTVTPTATQTDSLLSHPKYKSYNMIVADPSMVQLVGIRKNEVINIGTTCGGFASNTPAPASNTDPGAAAIQAAANYVKAQAQASTSSSK